MKPDIDALRTRAEQGDAEAQYNPEGLSALLNHYGPDVPPHLSSTRI